MDDQDIKIIKGGLIKTDRKLTMDFIHGGDIQGDLIKKSIEEISKVSNRISIRIKKDRDRQDSTLIVMPNLMIKAELKGKILEMLFGICDEMVVNKLSKYKEVLKNIKAPLFLKLYVVRSCPHCPRVVKDMSSLAIANSNIHIEIIDGLFYPEKAENDQIKSAPTLVFNNNFRWVGQVQIPDVVEVLTNVDPANLSSRSIQTMIEAGNATAVAEQMLEKGIVFDSLFELLLNENWSIRLGAMVVAEEIGHCNKQMADHIIDELWNRFDIVGDTLKGDIVYLTGEIGSTIYIEKLQAIMQQNPGSELMDALNDSMELLRDRIE
ncbi:MAG: thioredoxin family protein [Desulfobacteraceae bacterium]|jgi:hypothetical protein